MNRGIRGVVFVINYDAMIHVAPRTIREAALISTTGSPRHPGELESAQGISTYVFTGIELYTGDRSHYNNVL